MKIPLFALLALCFACPEVHAQAAKQTMAEAAQAMDVCRRVPKAMQADGQLIAMGCSQGVLDRVQNLNWSPFHAGVQTVLKANGLADVIKP